MTALSAGLDGPDTFDSPADLAAGLAARRERLGLSVRKVSQLTGIPSATVGGYFTGRHLPSHTQFDLFDTLLGGLGVPAEEFEAWHRALIRVRGGGPRGERAPYRGLEAFRAEDADLFFGRDDVLDQVRVALAQAQRGPIKLVSVVGASGAGKSSLVLAGLLPDLAEGTTAVITPGTAPDAALRSALDGGAAVIVVDQFEELLRLLPRDEHRMRFTALLDDAVRRDGGPTVVVTLRADRLAVALTDPILFDLLAAHQVLVGPMTEAGFRSAIVEPARVAQTPIGPGLVDVIVRDIMTTLDDVAALPFLSHALLATWTRVGGRTLTVSDYLAAGGLTGAVEHTAEAVYTHLDPEQQSAARDLFRRLVTVDDNGDAARRSLPLEDAADDAELIDKFVGVRILTTTADVVELAHDSLLRSWPRLLGWIEEDRDLLRTHRRVREATAQWQEGGEVRGDLARGALLTWARRLAESERTLAPAERRFVEASSAAADHEIRREQANRRRFRTLFVVVALLALIASGLAAYGFTENSHARAAQAEALSRATALQAEHFAATDPALATNLALAAYAISPTPEARAEVIEAAARTPITRLVGSPAQTHAVVSPDGQVFALAENDGTVQIWKRPAPGGVPVKVGDVVASRGNPQYAAAFSPDGRHLAVGGATQLTLIDVGDPAHPAVTASAHDGKATYYDVAFDRAGTHLVAATSAPSVVSYAVGQGALTQSAHRAGFGTASKSVAYSPDGATVAVGADDGVVHFLNATTLAPTGQLAIVPGHSVFSVAYSPRGGLLAASTNRSTVAIIGLAPQPHVIKTLGGFSNWVNGVSFDATGDRLAAAASQGAARIYSTRTWAVLNSFSASTNLTSPVFVPGAEALMASGVDGVALIYGLRNGDPTMGEQVWNTSATTAGGGWAYGASNGHVAQFKSYGPDDLRFVRMLPAPAGVSFAGTVAVSPNGNLVIGGGLSGDLYVWQIGVDGTSHPPAKLALGPGPTPGVAFSNDGRYAFAPTMKGTIAVYAVGPTGLTLAAKISTNTSPYSAAITTDGHLVATGNIDNSMSLYTFDGTHLAPAATETAAFSNYVTAVSFSPTAPLLIAGSQDKTAHVFDITDPHRPVLVGGPLGGSIDALFNSMVTGDGSLYAAAALTAGVMFYALSADGHGRVYAGLTGDGTSITGMSTSGAYVFTGSDTGHVQQWFARVEDAKSFLCAGIGTPLTASEWSQYVVGARPEAYC